MSIDEFIHHLKAFAMKTVKKTIGRIYREVFVYKVARKHHSERNLEHFDYLTM